MHTNHGEKNAVDHAARLRAKNMRNGDRLFPYAFAPIVQQNAELTHNETSDNISDESLFEDRLYSPNLGNSSNLTHEPTITAIRNMKSSDLSNKAISPINNRLNNVGDGNCVQETDDSNTMEIQFIKDGINRLDIDHLSFEKDKLNQHGFLNEQMLKLSNFHAGYGDLKQLWKSPFDSPKHEEKELAKSSLYIEKTSDEIYKLQFVAKNVNVSTLFVSPRELSTLTSEKTFQSVCHLLKSPIHKNDSVAHVARQPNAPGIEVNNVMMTQKGLCPPIQVYTDDLGTCKRSPSATGRVTNSGLLNIQYRDINFKISCGSLPITHKKSPVTGDVLAKIEKLKMATSETRKNKAMIIARCGHDLLQFTFDMSNITLTKAELKEATAVQTDDKMVYIKEKSQITGRQMLLALPESTYFYENPMDNIRRIHKRFKGKNAIPFWKYEMMKARLDIRRGFGEAEEKIKQILKHTRGSKLYFEGLGYILTVEGGMLNCEVSCSADKYETFIHKNVEQKPGFSDCDRSSNRIRCLVAPEEISFSHGQSTQLEPILMSTIELGMKDKDEREFC